MAPYRSRSLTPEDRLALAQEKLAAAVVEKREADQALRPLEARWAREVLRLESELAAAESRRDVAIEWQQGHMESATAAPTEGKGRGKGKRRPRSPILSVEAAVTRVEQLRLAIRDHPVTQARLRLEAAEGAWSAARTEVADLESVVRDLEELAKRAR